MEPRIWYNTLPTITKTYFVLSLLVLLVTLFYPASLQYMFLDWNLVFDQLEVWRLFACYLCWGTFIPACWQIGLLAHYFRNCELKHYRSHGDAFIFLLHLILSSSITFIVSYIYWPEVRFPAPVLLFYVITLYAWNDPNESSTFLLFTFARKWLPLAHWFLLYCIGVNWTLALFGMLQGYVVLYILSYLENSTGLRLPGFLLKIGEVLHLGEASKAWQVDRQIGERLGGTETTRWQS